MSTGAGFGAALRPGPPAPDPASADRRPGPTLFLSLFFLVSGGKREQENKRKAIRFRLLVVWGRLATGRPGVESERWTAAVRKASTKENE